MKSVSIFLADTDPFLDALIPFASVIVEPGVSEYDHNVFS